MPTQQNDEYAETMRRLFAQRMNGALSDLERECNQLRSNNVQLAERAQALEIERDRLAEQGVRDRELLVMVTVERDRLRALVREAMIKVESLGYSISLNDEPNPDRVTQLAAIDAWLSSARALLGEVG